jgi:hypothetical protein
MNFKRCTGYKLAHLFINDLGIHEESRDIFL